MPAPDVMGFTVTIMGIEQGIPRCLLAVAKILIGENLVIENSGNILANKMKELAPVWTTQLRESITVERVGPETVAVGPHVPYAIYMEDGAPPHTPPPGALAGWAADKGMTEAAIVYKIEHYGVDAHPFVKPALEAVGPEIEAELIGLTAYLAM